MPGLIIILPSPGRTLIIVRNLLAWLDITQRYHGKIVVIAGIWLVGMVDIFKIASHFEPLGIAQPQHVGTIVFTAATFKRANYRVSGDLGSCE